MRTLLVSLVACAVAACAHSYPPTVMPPASQPGRAEDRLELGSRYSTAGPRGDGYFRGGQRISLDEFLRVAGHGDAADTMTTRRWVKRGLVAGGVLAIAGGIAVGVTPRTCTEDDFELDRDYQACLGERGDRRWYAIGIGALGLGMILTGVELSTKQPGWSELSAWAAAHNRRHRIPARSAAITDVRLAPALRGDGGSLVLSGRF